MWKLALGVTVLSFAVACAGPAFAVQNWIIQEVTFDDANGDVNPIKGLEMRAADPGHYWHMNFQGGARRTSISGGSSGKYGRGAQFDGSLNSRILITELNRPVGPERPNDDSNGNFRFMLWFNTNLASPDRQEIFRASGSFAVELKDGQIKIRNEDPNNPHVYSTGLFPSTGTFHHLWVEYENPTVRVHVDFGSAYQVDFGEMTPWVPDGQTPTTGSMGSGFSGVLDELLVTIFSEVPESELRFDRKANNCPSGYNCEEFSLLVTPDQWSVQVPVRYKAVWKASTCTAQNRCPLLVMISGGGACADDYSPVKEVEAYAQRGFFVATVDPNCEYGYPWLQLPHETSQLIAAKQHVRAGPHANLIVQDYYHATGCSHGAQAVALWLMSETDHPKRAFARSANYAAHCTYHIAPCGPVWKSLDQVTCGSFTDPSPHDDSQSQPKQCIEEQWGVIKEVNKTAVQERELGAIWGRPSQEFDSCCCRKGCTESLEGNDLGGRFMRDYWRATEQAPPVSPPTGWFWEWAPTQQDTCTHCPWDGVNGDIARCSACFLHHGYNGMNSVSGCEDCDNMDPGGQPRDACPAEWGMPGGGSDLPCEVPPPQPVPICPSPPPPAKTTALWPQSREH